METQVDTAIREESLTAAQIGPPQESAAGKAIVKKSTGVAGFDDITGGGLPANRLTAIIGGPGAGKTVFAMQTLVNRLHAENERGVFVTFEEPIEGIRQNMSAFDWPTGWDSADGIGFLDARGRWMPWSRVSSTSWGFLRG